MLGTVGDGSKWIFLKRGFRQDLTEKYFSKQYLGVFDSQKNNWEQIKNRDFVVISVPQIGLAFYASERLASFSPICCSSYFLSFFLSVFFFRIFLHALFRSSWRSLSGVLFLFLFSFFLDSKPLFPFFFFFLFFRPPRGSTL